VTGGAVTIPPAPSLPRYVAAHISDMFAIDEATIEAIRRALDEGGELSVIVKLRRRFPLITDNAQARLCVRHRELAAGAGTEQGFA
jgi:hypothetical protein